jgi:hypothetical protein
VAGAAAAPVDGSVSAWSSAADAAAQWRDSMTKMWAASAAWWPWGQPAAVAPVA